MKTECKKSAAEHTADMSKTAKASVNEACKDTCHEDSTACNDEKKHKDAKCHAPKEGHGVMDSVKNVAEKALDATSKATHNLSEKLKD